MADTGLLSVAVQPFYDRAVSDITIVPVSISYHERMESALYAGMAACCSDVQPRFSARPSPPSRSAG